MTFYNMEKFGKTEVHFARHGENGIFGHGLEKVANFIIVATR